MLGIRPVVLLRCTGYRIVRSLHSTTRLHKEDDGKNDGDLLDLDSVFDMLDPIEPSKEPKQSTNSHTDHNDFIDNDFEELNLDGIFKTLNENRSKKSNSSSSKQPFNDFEKPQREENNYSHSTEADPMEEFERILSDLAVQNKEVYKEYRPSPGFWKENESARSSHSSKEQLQRSLDPESLFKRGPAASAFSAGKLAGNPNRISSLAARFKKESESLKKDNNILGQQGASGTKTNNRYKGLSKRLEAEQVILSQLSLCQTITSLTKLLSSKIFPYSSNFKKQKNATKVTARVVAEAIHVARKLNAPYLAYYIYNHCRTKLAPIDMLRILDSPVYEELIRTAWTNKQDTAAIISMIQDLVSFGITGSSELSKQINEVVYELRELKMETLSSKIMALNKKIHYKNAIPISRNDSSPRNGLPSRFL